MPMVIIITHMMTGYDHATNHTYHTQSDNRNDPTRADSAGTPFPPLAALALALAVASVCVSTVKSTRVSLI